MADRDVTIDVIARDKTDRAVRSATRNFDQLQKKVKKATDSIPASVAGAFARLASAVPPQVAIAGAAIGLALAPAIGAAVTAAVLLGVGGSVLAAGIVAAANSPAVKSAWTRFTERGKKAFADFGKPFEGPVSRALETFGDSLERMAPTLNAMGRSIAPIIDKLAPALASMAEKALPGFQIALEAAKPLFDKLAEHAPKIGEAITKMLAYISAGGPGATKFLDHALTALEKILPFIGAMFLAFSVAYDKISTASGAFWTFLKNAFATGVRFVIDVIGTIVSAAAAAFGWIPGLGPKLKDAEKKFGEFRTKTNAELAKLTQPKLKVNKQQAEKDIADFNRKADHAARARTVTLSVAQGIIGGARVAGRRAHGGPVSAGRSYLVGEQGAEVVTMGANGHVTPNHELGGDTHVYVTIDGQQLEGRIDRVVRESNRGLKRRAGAFAP